MFLKVFVTPAVRREKVEEKELMLCISVREPAARNRANIRVRELVAERFGVSITSVRIYSGHRSRSKILSIEDGK